MRITYPLRSLDIVFNGGIITFEKIFANGMQQPFHNIQT